MADDKKYDRKQLEKKTVAELKELFLTDEGGEVTDLDSAPKFVKAELVGYLADIDASEDEEELEDELEEELEDEVEVEEEEDLPEEEPELDDEEDDLELPEEDEVEVEEEAPAPAAKKTRTRKPKADAAEGDGSGTMAAKQVATLLGTEAKTLRQFFRSAASTTEAVGSGGRYEFNESDLPKITEEFTAWKAGHGARGNKRTGEGTTKKSRKAEAPVIEEVEELEIEDLEEEELELEDED